MSFGIAGRDPVKPHIIDGGAVVAPRVAVIQQPVAERQAYSRLEILRVVAGGEITASTAADKPLVRQT